MYVCVYVCTADITVLLMHAVGHMFAGQYDHHFTCVFVGARYVPARILKSTIRGRETTYSANAAPWQLVAPEDKTAVPLRDKPTGPAGIVVTPSHACTRASTRAYTRMQVDDLARLNAEGCEREKGRYAKIHVRACVCVCMASREFVRVFVCACVRMFCAWLVWKDDRGA